MELLLHPAPDTHTHLAKLLVDDTKFEVVADDVLVKSHDEARGLQGCEESLVSATHRPVPAAVSPGPARDAPGVALRVWLDPRRSSME